MTSVINSSTNPKAVEQMIVGRGEGVYDYDSKGNKYLAGLAGLWCTSLGGMTLALRPPLVITTAQVDELIGKFLRGLEQTPVQI